MLEHAINHPVSVVREQIVSSQFPSLNLDVYQCSRQRSGTAQPSFVAQQLEDLAREGELTPETQYDVSLVAHQIFGGMCSRPSLLCSADLRPGGSETVSGAEVFCGTRLTTSIELAQHHNVLRMHATQPECPAQGPGRDRQGRREWSAS